MNQTPGMFRRYVDAFLYVAVVALAFYAVAFVMVMIGVGLGWM